MAKGTWFDERKAESYKTHKGEYMIQIMPLSEDNLKGALEVLDAEFGHEKENADNYKTWLPNSLPDGNPRVAAEWAKRNIQHLKYWVAFDPEKKKVVGVTGLYSKHGQKDLAWLAWTSVLELDDTREIEDALMELSIAVARSLGKTYLADYFDEGEEDQGIRDLLIRHGFLFCEMQSETEAPDGAIHYQLDLKLNF